MVVAIDDDVDRALEVFTGAGEAGWRVSVVVQLMRSALQVMGGEPPDDVLHELGAFVAAQYRYEPLEQLRPDLYDHGGAAVVPLR
jgi:hypothetical protein